MADDAPIVDDGTELRRTAAALGALPTLAFDAEGDGLYRYRARLCTVQFASPTAAAVVDALALADVTPLESLLRPTGPRKIIHDAAFDARIVATRGLALGNVFDTAVAARFLGEPATGLATLLERDLGVVIDKAQQTADWGRRPLERSAIDYLLADVRHLIALAELLEERLRAVDALEEVEEESAYVLAAAREPEAVKAPWTRIKGARDLPARPRALLAALADVRERVAGDRDVPPFRVASNGAIFEAAKRRCTTALDLGRIGGLAELAPHYDEVLARAAEGPPSEPVAPAPPLEERTRRKALERALLEWRTREAAQRGVDAQVVLPGHCIRDLVSLGPAGLGAIAAVPGLGAKRADRYGPRLAALLVERSGGAR